MPPNRRVTYERAATFLQNLQSERHGTQSPRRLPGSKGKLERHLRHPLRLMVALSLALLPMGCGGSDGGSGSSLACRYVENSYTTCSGYSSSDQYEGCRRVSAEAECRESTESSTDCSGDCCWESIYTDVRTTPGSCEDPAPSGGMSSTGGSSSSGGGASDACTPGDPTSACSVCMADSCCGPLNACASSSTCSSLLSCIAECATDTACIDACSEAFPGGVDPLNTLFACVDAYCPTECA